MVRLTACLTCLFGLPALAPAQGVVVAAYPPAPVVTAYYAPAVSYYTPAPVVTAYVPAVSYYRTPAVVSYRYPLLRPWTTVVRVTPGATVAVPSAPVVASYYAPAVVVP